MTSPVKIIKKRKAEDIACSAKGPPPLRPTQKRIYIVKHLFNLTGNLNPGFIKAKKMPPKKQIRGKLNTLFKIKEEKFIRLPKLVICPNYFIFLNYLRN